MLDSLVYGTTFVDHDTVPKGDILPMKPMALPEVTNTEKLPIVKLVEVAPQKMTFLEHRRSATDQE